ncbi:MAG: hypothetical protein MZV70_05675 [Desulfobacterales bacterium]|nr:hypothetical protein [Desulfobacterales bacterium]
MNRFSGAILLLIMAAGLRDTGLHDRNSPARSGTPPGRVRPMFSARASPPLRAGLTRRDDQAISDALRKAVEQGVGAYIDGETRVENFQLISDRIYSRASGFVSSYRVIHEEQLGRSLPGVVSPGSCEHRWHRGRSRGHRNSRAGQGRPRVMVLVRGTCGPLGPWPGRPG